MAEQSEWRLRSGQYLGEISALCFLHLPPHLFSLPYLLAGTGSQMLLYDLEAAKMIRSFHVFEGIRVHGISCSFINCTEKSVSSTVAFNIAVFGERRVKLFSLHLEIVSGSQNQSEVHVELTLFHLLPKFSHWVLDVCFLKNYIISSCEGSCCLAVGCSDNSVCIWDILRSCVILEVRCPERCLLYSMRLWGDEIETLRIASGTIYNEIIVWKVVPQNCTPSLRSPVKDQANLSGSFHNSLQLHDRGYEAVHICRLAGHEGSIFRIAWSSNGSKLVSVSDDRCARIWTVRAEIKDSDNPMDVVGPVLFGHNARVWDCCIFDSLIVTAGEDCTCRVWGLNGDQIKMIKEHIGRGIWRCLYEPNSSLLVTAGFDSSIKVHRLRESLSRGPDGHDEEDKAFVDRSEVFTFHIPNLSQHIGLMDSKSEYVRCLHFASEDTLYVATNNGYLYHAKLSDTGDVKWTALVRVCEEVPIVCMDLLPGYDSNLSSGIENWVAVGDGKGSMTIVKVINDVCSPKVGLTFTWSAGMERQLLGTYWCKSLGNRHVFTADPRGILKLWRFCDSSQSVSENSMRNSNVSLAAEFISSLGIRIMCLNASFEDEVLVCGDLRGNLVLFPLLKSLLLGTSVAPEVRIPPLNYFKGAHGISSISSISIARFRANQIEIRSTGADGCICYLEYDRDQQNIEFIGMKQVKELSLIQSVSADSNNVDDLASGTYAIGFSSANFIIWNLLTERKVVQVPCGGWRRPHSYYLGDVPEMMNCFAYVKDETIYVHRHWVPYSERKMLPQNLHMQFHGREIHSLCFISEESQYIANSEHRVFPKSSWIAWIATGCEDGTVRLTRYTPGVENWSSSKLLGEHVGGSAVRSVCFVSKVHIIATDVTSIPNVINRQNAASEDRVNPLLLISVGAKRVLTSWLLRNRRMDNNEEALDDGTQNENGNGFKPSAGMSSSLSFQWLSTDMPTKYSSSHKKTEKIEKIAGAVNDVSCMKVDATSGPLLPENREMELKTCVGDDLENDWRYLAVTAFLVKGDDSRLTVCFVVVACSDATLALRALILPHRFWFDIALFIPISSPVLALQHVVIPVNLPSEDEIQIRSLYIVISGSTDGSIAFWDLTESVEAFMRRVSTLHIGKSIDYQKRPRTGRGSQGGRWWRSLSVSVSKRKTSGGLVTVKDGDGTNDHMLNQAACGTSTNLTDPENSTAACSHSTCTASLESEVHTDDSSFRICEIWPLHVLTNLHQSGVNCLHVSDIKDSQNSGFLYNVLSGGDDQALHCLIFDLQLLPSVDSENKSPDIINRITESDSLMNFICYSQNRHYRIRFLNHDRVASAHSSAVKGVWTDGSWVFSTGLDQRVRCWHLEEHGKLTERAHLVISVPEPEALDAQACTRNHYQIAVAGRGMQMVEFFAPCEMDDGDRNGI
ncbi:hypothetical protein L1049_007353 [Liquidambar formosana]|uniref:WD repeat-containing protein 6 n=1 Tax=Liquidambar formosana TaxID=63359 RepID=A0AAP0R320_LIQFO